MDDHLPLALDGLERMPPADHRAIGALLTGFVRRDAERAMPTG